MRYAELFGRAWAELADSERGLEIELLIAKAFRFRRERFWIDRQKEIHDPDGLSRFRGYFSRLQRGEPISYILGEKEFYSEKFLVNRHVLIPRPETEYLVEQALALIPSGGGNSTVLDIGSGCGNIAVVLALRSPVRVWALEKSRKALAVLERNVRRFDLQNRVIPLQGDLFPGSNDPVRRFDLVVSNPPYLARCEWTQLSASIRDYEPRRALVAGVSGLEVIERIIGSCRRHLKSGGHLLMEIGRGQRPEVERMLARSGWPAPAWIRDGQGLDRVAVVRR